MNYGKLNWSYRLLHFFLACQGFWMSLPPSILLDVSILLGKSCPHPLFYSFRHCIEKCIFFLQKKHKSDIHRNLLHIYRAYILCVVFWRHIISTWEQLKKNISVLKSGLASIPHADIHPIHQPYLHIYILTHYIY